MKKSILYITDLYFEAKGRRYYEEDLYLTNVLRDDYEVLICHPCDSEKFETQVDLIIFRNAGPVMNYKNYFDAFVKRVNTGLLSYNPMNGKADQMGKQYLITLTAEGYPVIPTIENLKDLHRLPEVEKYMVKLKNGADSIGMQVVDSQSLHTVELTGSIVQPFIDFEYEVSFYFVDQDLQYSLYAPDKSKRWNLEQYQATADDVAFAKQFINWNNLSHGIQRVDACRLPNGELLLVELEDLNPYLSIGLLPTDLRDQFVVNFKNSIRNVI